METDSDSDASHISATPPRNSNPPPIPPSPKSRVRVPLISNPKPRPKSKPRPELKASDQGPPDPPPFPIADLSTLHGLTVRTHRLPDQNHTASFSSLVRSRRPSFDPSDFQKDDNLKANVGGVTENHKDEAPPCDSQPSNRVGSHARMERVHPCWIGSDVHTEQPKCTSNSRPSGRVENRARIERVHPCWIGSDVPSEQLKRPKFSNEGNFVRLNINGHGRKYGYRNGKRRFSASSKAQRYRRRSVGDKFNADAGTKMGPGTLEDDSLDASWDQKRKSDCSSELIEEAVVAAREELSDQNLKNLLKLTHGYDSFREGQLETIKRVVAGESMMLVLPTGAGKSLCYQLPALILPGITLVVSPLVALMVDQLRQLPPAIPGGLLSSTQTSEEASTTLHRLLGGDIKVLFVSPERFLNAEFLSLFGDTLSVSLVVIDEAHCISEWSHNFRPSYLRLRASLLRAKLNAECYLAMTATATTQTLHDIMNALEIPSTNLIQTCQIRKNLQLFMTLSVNRLKDLLMLMKSTPLVGMRSIIIYCKFQAETDLVSKYLCDNNIPAKGYHSGILAKNRIRVQELFCSNKIRVVVATVAFGMGLDKSDVEAVIHYSLPESLEEYIQETGRAGRDGRLSYCHLLLEYSTYYKLRSLMYSDGVDEYSISKLLSHIFSIDIPLAGNICSLVKESTSRKFDMKEEVLLTILTQLEMGDVQYLCLLPQLNVTCTLYFHKTPPALLSIKDVLIATILKKSETKQGHYVFDIPTVANHVGITAIELLNQLQNLKYLGEITYDVKDPAFCFMIMKKPDDFCSLTTFLTKWLSEVESCKVQKLDAMFNVATFAVKECKRIDGCSDSMHTICIQTKILDYFCRDHNTSHDYCSVDMVKTSRFLSADIKVFLQSNSYAKFTPRAVARIMHGIPSPAFPSSTWSKCHFWGRYMEVDFPIIMKAATMELVNFVRKGEV